MFVDTLNGGKQQMTMINTRQPVIFVKVASLPYPTSTKTNLGEDWLKPIMKASSCSGLHKLCRSRTLASMALLK
jgi:hypothetical protein